MRERGGLLALLAAIGAMTYRSVSPGPTAASPAAKTVESSVLLSEQPTEELSKAFSAFDRRVVYRIDLEDKNRAITARPVPGGDPSAVRLMYEWVIAIVPDPQNSNMKLDFDRNLEMLQLAARNAGYQFERYWLPWRDEEPAPADKKYVLETGAPAANVAYTVAPKENDVEGLPGVLLFRGSGESSKPLALFLVSESPTGGVDANQFRSAVRLGRALSNHDQKTCDQLLCDDRLRIVGPGFSGSLDSLSTLINSEPEPFSGLAIRTWTANPDAINGFKKALGVQFPAFRSVQVDSKTALLTFARHVRSYWHDDTPFVVLTEEQTVFGQSASKLDDNTRPGEGHIWRIPFPRNLSQLRNATEKQDHLPGFGDNSRRDMPRNGLILSLRQESPAKLEIPIFSKEQTPLSEESVLSTISGLLKTHTVHYVGILATDPLDTLFLARYLRSACPNVRIFTFNPDLMFEHGSDSSDFSGIYGISSYPLFPFSQLWTQTKTTNELYAFASGTAESVYNAALEIFKQIPSSSIFAAPYDETRDERNPFSSSNPLWITVAGRSGFEPVAVLGTGESQGSKSSAPNFAVEYWPGWGYTFAALLSLCFAFCALMLFSRRDGHPLFAMFSPQPDTYLWPDDYDPVPRAFYLSCIGLCLTLLATVWLVVPGIVVRRNLLSPAQQPTVLLAQLGFTIAGALCMALLRYRSSLLAGASDQTLLSPAVQPKPSGGFVVFCASGSLLFTIPALLMNPFASTPVSTLPKMWLFFCFGCFFVGATLAASAFPVLGARQYAWAAIHHGGAKRMNGASAVYAVATVVLFVFTVALAGFAARTIAVNSPFDFMAAYRSLDLTNGMSPLVPATLLFTGLLAVAVVQLRRVNYYEDRCPSVPSMAGDEFCPKLDSIVEDVKMRIRRATFHPMHYVVVLLTIVLAVKIFRGSAQTLEGWPLEYLILGSALALAIFILLVWIRLLLVWSAFSEVLQQLERHPIRQIFSLLPRGFVWSPVWQGGGKKRIHVAITRSLESMHALVSHPETPDGLKNAVDLELSANRPGSLLLQVKSLLEASADRRRFPRPEYKRLERTLRRVARCAVIYLRSAKWNQGDYELRSELAQKEETRDALHTSRPEYLKQEPATICGELVAFRFLALINFVLWHIDNLVTYVSVGFLLLVIGLNSYAFRSRTIIDWLLVLLFAILSTGIITVFAQADRDAILSRITGTQEGKLDRHFFTHLISYGAIPALVLAATHFPTIGRFFFSWVKPALEAIH